MKLRAEDIQKVASLSQLPISDSENEMYKDQLSEILDYIDKLGQAKTDDIETIFNVTGRLNILDEDIAKNSLSQEEAVLNASQKQDGLFVTKGVFENE